MENWGSKCTIWGSREILPASSVITEKTQRTIGIVDFKPTVKLYKMDMHNTRLYYGKKSSICIFMYWKIIIYRIRKKCNYYSIT